MCDDGTAIKKSVMDRFYTMKSLIEQGLSQRQKSRHLEIEILVKPFDLTDTQGYGTYILHGENQPESTVPPGLLPRLVSEVVSLIAPLLPSIDGT